MRSIVSTPRPARESHFDSAFERVIQVLVILFAQIPLLTLTVSLAFAQAPRQPWKTNPQGIRRAQVIRKSAVNAKLNPNLVRENRRPAISYVPFAMVDPYTGKPVAPNTIIKFPNGKKTTAEKYYSQLNQVEQWLTQRGYSLRLPHHGGAINEIVSDKARMQQQLQTIPSAKQTAPSMESLLKFRAGAVLKNDQIRIDAPAWQAAHPGIHLDPNRLQLTASKINAVALRGSVLDGLVVNQMSWVTICKTYPELCPLISQQTDCNPIHNVKEWAWGYGDMNTLSATYQGQLVLDGEACKPRDMNHVDQNNSHFELSASSTSWGSIFGISGDVLDMKGAVNVSGANSTADLNFSVNVLGQTTYTFSGSQNAEWSKQDSFSQPIDFGGATISVPLVGPISLDVSIGARGDVGLSYSIYLNPIFINGNIDPFANTSVYAQLGIGVPEIVEAGVGYNLTLVDSDLQLGAKAGVAWLTDFILEDEVYGYLDLNLLAGDLYLYAQIGHPCWDLPPWCVDQYDTTIWSEPGLMFARTLFDEKNDVELPWLTSANTDMQGSRPPVSVGTP